MHTDLRVSQIVAEMLGQRLYGGFTCIVRWITRRVRYALLTTRDDNGRWLIRRTRLETGDISIQSIDHAVKIRVQYLPPVSVLESLTSYKEKN